MEKWSVDDVLNKFDQDLKDYENMIKYHNDKINEFYHKIDELKSNIKVVKRMKEDNDYEQSK